MTKTKLIEALAYECGLTKKESRTIVDTIFKLITEALEKGEDVTITYFASFRIKERRSKVYKHSTTVEVKTLPPRKRVKVKMSEKVMRGVDPGSESTVED